jgi:hypothetical protein
MKTPRHFASLCLGAAWASRVLAADTPGIVTPTAPIVLPAAPLSAVERETAIELPPMIIAESSKAPPWLYARVGETEYLSRCTAATTRAYITSQMEISRMLRVFMPADFFSPTAVPIVSILAPLDSRQDSDDVAAREMQRMQQKALERLHEEGRRELKVPNAGRLRFLPNLRLDDRDMLAVFTYLNEKDFRRERIIAAPDYLYARLVARTPTLPPWLIEGLVGLYQQSLFTEQPITMDAAQWVSPADTAGLRRDAESRRVMLPAGDLFAARALVTAENQHPARVAAWRAQAVLFVRWALDPANAPAADSFWKLAQRSATDPITEAIFVGCFGFGYSDLQERLSDYLPVAVKQPARIPPGKLPALPRFDVKPATPAQIARLRGEWERLEIPFVRGKHPEFVPRYIEQARLTLRRPVGRGERDPQMLAALGLCELDAGDIEAARPWLEEAAAARVQRPRVHYEVARLRWLDLTRNTGENMGFTAAQVQPVLEPLRVAAAQIPALPEVYLLLGDALLRSRDRVSASDLALLVKAVPLFRRLPPIAFRLALVQLRDGQRPGGAALLADAAQTLTVASEFVTDTAMRTHFEQLLAAVKGATKIKIEGAAEPSR